MITLGLVIGGLLWTW